MKKKQIRASNTCYNKYYIGKVCSVVAKGAKLSDASILKGREIRVIVVCERA